jgi:hypothetical protein
MRMRPASRFSAAATMAYRFFNLVRASASAQRGWPAPSRNTACVRSRYAVGVQLLDEGDHLLEMVEVLAVHHQVYREGASLFLCRWRIIARESSILCACALAPAIQLAESSRES